MTAEEYRSQKDGNSLNHFYEKLFLLKDMMLTEEGKRIAEVRHQRMKDFVDNFWSEIEGES